MAAAGLIMIAIAAAIVLRQRAPSSPPPIVRIPDESSIALSVQHDGAALRLRWNPEAAAIRAATAGVLSISDGVRQSRLDLNAQDLRSGVASYWPESREVTFRLALNNDAAGTIRASADAPAAERPSPFEPKASTAAPRASRRAPEDAEDDPPSAQPPARTIARERTEAVDDADRDSEEPAPKPSRWRRLAGKIPLVRRLHKH
jgi:hypothetical protein